MNKNIIPEPIKFEWDGGNKDKNFKKHGVINEESESVFYDEHSVLADNPRHSTVEKRYQVVGLGAEGKILNIIFTLRKNKVRVISARQANKKERKLYEITKTT